jgi:hypothetical protein
LLGFGYKLRWIARSRRLSAEGESESGLVFDYPRLSPMIGDDSLLPIQAEEGESERYLLTRERERKYEQDEATLRGSDNNI